MNYADFENDYKNNDDSTVDVDLSPEVDAYLKLTLKEVITAKDKDTNARKGWMLRFRIVGPTEFEGMTVTWWHSDPNFLEETGKSEKAQRFVFKKIRAMFVAHEGLDMKKFSSTLKKSGEIPWDLLEGAVFYAHFVPKALSSDGYQSTTRITEAMYERNKKNSGALVRSNSPSGSHKASSVAAADDAAGDIF